MNKFLGVIQSTQAKMKNGRIEGKDDIKESQNDESKAVKPLSELFKPKAGSWECQTCLIRNNKESEKCVSCETPKPGSKSSSNGKIAIFFYFIFSFPFHFINKKITFICSYLYSRVNYSV